MAVLRQLRCPRKPFRKIQAGKSPSLKNSFQKLIRSRPSRFNDLPKTATRKVKRPLVIAWLNGEKVPVK